MKLRANFGDVYVSLPCCFRGPITIRTRGDRLAFSPALKERTALISDVCLGRPGILRWRATVQREVGQR